MKLAGSELMFGNGSLAYIKTIKAKKSVSLLADEAWKEVECWQK